MTSLAPSKGQSSRCEHAVYLSTLFAVATLLILSLMKLTSSNEDLIVSCSTALAYQNSTGAAQLTFNDCSTMNWVSPPSSNKDGLRSIEVHVNVYKTTP